MEPGRCKELSAFCIFAFLLLYLDDQLGVEMEVFYAAISIVPAWVANNARAIGYIVQIVVRVPVYPHAHLAKQMIQVGVSGAVERKTGLGICH